MKSACIHLVAATTAVLLLVATNRPAFTAESDLVARLSPLIKAHKGKVSVAIKHLDSGESYRHQADEPMPTASLIKFPVMVEAYRQAEAKQIDLGKTLTLREADRAPGSGILTTHFSPGATLTLRDAIRLMIAFSDNTATNLVIEEIGLPATAKQMEALGLPNTKLHAKVFRGDTSIFPERSKQFGLGSTTAGEMIKMLELLYQKKLGSAASCDAMLEHLAKCEDKDKMTRLLPERTKVAHKTGSVNSVRTDAGIIFSPKGPIALCVLTAENEDRSWTRDNAADRLCGDIAKAVYDHFNPSSSEPKSVPPEVLKVGESGPLVESLQRTLNERLSPAPNLAVDGDFGPATERAVKEFQRSKDLRVTGEVGPETWKALGPLVEKGNKVPEPAVVNGEQLKRNPPDKLNGPPLVTCKAWAVADGKTGKFLWGSAENTPLDFASTTKMMTAHLVLNFAAADAKVLDEEVTFSERADKTGGSTADIRHGERLPVHELLYGLMLPSGNDASVALAEHFGGRCEAPDDKEDETDPLARFVAEMNRTATKLEMKSTHYANPHGLSAKGHVSTAADLLKLAFAALQDERFRQYVNTPQHGCQVTGASGYQRNVLWKNTNQLLKIENYDGVKTGTTDGAGACLVSRGRRGEDQLLMVVLGSTSSDARYVDSRNLYRWAWVERGHKE